MAIEINWEAVDKVANRLAIGDFVMFWASEVLKRSTPPAKPVMIGMHWTTARFGPEPEKRKQWVVVLSGEMKIFSPDFQANNPHYHLLNYYNDNDNWVEPEQREFISVAVGAVMEKARSYLEITPPDTVQEAEADRDRLRLQLSLD